MKLLRIKCIRIYILIVGAGIGATASNAQKHNFRIPEINFSYGLAVYETVLPEGYKYNPLFIVASCSVWKKGGFNLYSEWQFAKLQNAAVQKKADFESGINIGLKYSLPINPILSISFAGGVGPHFITAETERQAAGFIFSDNIEAGIYIKPPDHDWKFHFTGRFRHISNAGLKRPNGGINNGFILIGVAKSI